MGLPAKKFSVGDILTYKSKKNIPRNKYYYGGTLEKGVTTGELKKYGSFVASKKCYAMHITYNKRKIGTFKMLESEFEEFNKTIEYEIY